MGLKKVIPASLFLLLFLSGCGYRYNSRSLKHVRKSKADFIAKKEEVELRVKQLGPKKIRRLFNGQRLNSKCIVSMLLTVKNHSSENVLVDQSAISLNLLTAEQIRSRLSRNIPMRLVGGATAIPVIAVATCASVVFGAWVCGASACVGLGLFVYALIANIYIFIPVIVGTTGYKTIDAHKFNKELSKDLNRKVILHQTVDAHKKRTMLLFAKNAPKEFEVTLFKGEQGTELKFNVILKGAT